MIILHKSPYTRLEIDDSVWDDTEALEFLLQERELANEVLNVNKK